MRYTEVTLTQMKALLGMDWSEVNEDSLTQEHVFEKVVFDNPKIVVRVFSSIHRNTDVGREKGTDAIRVCAVNLTLRKGWISTSRVLRVEGWRTNLLKAISKTTQEALQRLGDHAQRRSNFFANQIKVNDEKKMPASPAWGLCDDGSYSAEASTLDANRENFRRDICPKCNHQFGRTNMTKIIRRGYGEDQETIGWEFECPHCHTKLTVFND